VDVKFHFLHFENRKLRNEFGAKREKVREVEEIKYLEIS
jgi:hypothetical protein